MEREEKVSKQGVRVAARLDKNEVKGTGQTGWCIDSRR